MSVPDDWPPLLSLSTLTTVVVGCDGDSAVVVVDDAGGGGGIIQGVDGLSSS